MLQLMRKHAKYFYFLFFIIIVAFISWGGMGTVDKSTNLPVAEVGKEKITIDEYDRAYRNASEFYREIYKEKFTEEMERKLDLKGKVLELLIEERVLLLAAKDMGIKVGDDELEDAIKHVPAFTRNGVFDENIYEKTLQLSYRVPKEVFENSQRQELMIMKIKRLIGESVDLTDAEVRQLHGEEQIMNALMNKRAQAVSSYVEGFKNRINIKRNSQLIS